MKLVKTETKVLGFDLQLPDRREVADILYIVDLLTRGED